MKTSSWIPLLVLLAGCAASWPRDLGDDPRDSEAIADHPVLGHLADALADASDVDVARLLEHDDLTFERAPDPTALLERLHDEHTQLEPLEDPVELEILIYNVAFLDRKYLSGSVQSPFIPERRDVLLDQLFETDADVIFLQEVWDWEDAQLMVQAAEEAGYATWAGSEKRHEEMGLITAVRAELVEGASDQQETRFRAQRKIEHWPGPNIKRGFLSWSFDLAGTSQRLHLVNLHATSFPQYARVRNMQARQVGLALDEVPDDTIVIVGGDFNSGPFYKDDVWITNEGDEEEGWWPNATAWALWQHYGGLQDMHSLPQVAQDVVAGRTVPEGPSTDGEAYDGAWCDTVEDNVFTGTDCNLIYEQQYGGTEFPARLDHLMLRDTRSAVRVLASEVVFTERQDLGTGEPIEWSDHYGVQATVQVAR